MLPPCSPTLVFCRQTAKRLMNIQEAKWKFLTRGGKLKLVAGGKEKKKGNYSFLPPRYFPPFKMLLPRRKQRIEKEGSKTRVEGGKVESINNPNLPPPTFPY